MSPQWVEPDWPAPPGVRALSSLRGGGVSQGVYAGFNLGLHVGDEPEKVAANRRLLRQIQELPAEPFWLNQVHGNAAVRARADSRHQPPEADASFSHETGVVCAVMTADCLPVLFCDREGTRVAAAHAGWRGLAGGILQTTVEALETADLMAWLGPAIGPHAFEVGEPVRDTFLDRFEECSIAFTQVSETRWLADLYLLARLILARTGVTEVYGGDYCTYTEPDRFFSYRRDGQTGRMATLIWRERTVSAR